MKSTTRDFSTRFGIFVTCVWSPCYTAPMSQIMRVAIPLFPFTPEDVLWEGEFRQSLFGIQDFEGSHVADWPMCQDDNEDEAFAPCVLSHYAFIFGALPEKDVLFPTIIERLLAVTDEDYLNRLKFGTVPPIRFYSPVNEE